MRIEALDGSTFKAQMIGVAIEARSPEMIVVLTGISLEDVAIGTRICSLGTRD